MVLMGISFLGQHIQGSPFCQAESELISAISQLRVPRSAILSAEST